MVVRTVSFMPNQMRLIGLVGFEPTASSSRTRRSTKLSHSPRCAAAECRGLADYFAYLGRDSKKIARFSTYPLRRKKVSHFFCSASIEARKRPRKVVMRRRFEDAIG